MTTQPLDLPGAPEPGTRLCALDEIADPGAKGFVFGAGSQRFEMFVVRGGQTVHAYVNACPHKGTPLDVQPDLFLTTEKDLILCSTHGARFRPKDGFCVAGPCDGQSLTGVPIHIDNGTIAIGAPSA